MSPSLIYRNVWVYRTAMNVLYQGRYRARFSAVAALLRADETSVLELCFGDTEIAEHCRKHGIAWTGLDVSEAFVARARSAGYDARHADLSLPLALPPCDVCVMMGSLYHFKPRLEDLFCRIKSASKRFILSEPVITWTRSNRLLRFLARKGTRVGSAEETFRFDSPSLLAALDELHRSVGFTYRVVSVERDMIVEVIWSK